MGISTIIEPVVVSLDLRVSPGQFRLNSIWKFLSLVLYPRDLQFAGFTKYLQVAYRFLFICNGSNLAYPHVQAGLVVSSYEVTPKPLTTFRQ